MQGYNNKPKYNYDDIDVPPMVQYHKPKPNADNQTVKKRSDSSNRRTPPRNDSGQRRKTNAGNNLQQNRKNTSYSGQQKKRPIDNRNFVQRTPQNKKRPRPNPSPAPPPIRKKNGYNNQRKANSGSDGFVSSYNNFKKKYPWVQPLILGIIVALIILGIAFASKMIGGSDEKNNSEPKKQEPQAVTLTENLTAGTVQGNLRQWSGAEDGIIQDENVMNVLLLGVDDTDGESRSDAIILMSLNKETKKISLVSFYRDSYAYIQDENGGGHFSKINYAYKLGGGDLAVKTVERLFKVKIDHFVSVNFKTFTNVIDELGGIDIDVEKYESDFIRRTSRYKDMPYGENVHLDGARALVYARIRKCDADSDISRTRRQRKVVDALIAKTKTASIGQLAGLADQLLPYVVTDFSKKDIVSTGTQAVTQKWMDYEKHQISCVTIEENGWNKSLNGTDIVLVDYPACAKKLQETLYGKSLITLSGDAQTRLTVNELFTQEKIFES